MAIKLIKNTIVAGSLAASGGAGVQYGKQLGSPVLITPPIEHEQPEEYAKKVCKELKWMVNPCELDELEAVND